MQLPKQENMPNTRQVQDKNSSIQSNCKHSKKHKNIHAGSTENSFKDRYYSHKTSMRDAKYRNSTTLSNYYWECRDKGETPNIQWEILRTCKTYRPGARKCDICLTEKMLILRERGPHSLNKRSELMYKCPHRSKWKLMNVKECVS